MDCSTNDTTLVKESVIAQQKIDFNEKMEQLNLELIELKGKEKNKDCELKQSVQKIDYQGKQITSLNDSNEELKSQYEKRINDLIHEMDLMNFNKTAQKMSDKSSEAKTIEKVRSDTKSNYHNTPEYIKMKDKISALENKCKNLEEIVNEKDTKIHYFETIYNEKDQELNKLIPINKLYRIN